MRIGSQIRSLLSGLFRSSRVAGEIAEELQSHIDHRADDLERSGISRAEALRRARIEFGGYEGYRESAQRAAGGSGVLALAQDLRFGVRVLRKSPAFTATAIALLALGIGATTAVFSLVDAVLLKPLPFPQPQQIVMPWDRPPAGVDIGGYSKFPWDPIRFHAMKRLTGTYQYLGAFQSANFNLTGAGEPALLAGLRVTWGFFPALGATPELGRIFTKAEDQPGHEREAILSDALWRERFHADTGIVGRSIDLNGAPYTVIGVMPRGFDFPRANEMPPDFDFPREAQLWIPAALPAVTPRFTPSELAVVGRLRPGVSVAQAQAAMDLWTAQMDRAFPNGKGWFGSRVIPLEEQVVGDTRTPLLLMLAAVGAVLLIACLNVAGLQLTRAMARGREFSLRTALGAERRRIVSQLLVENLLISAAGAVGGLGLAYAGVWLVKQFGPTGIPRLSEAAPDLRVAGFLLLATLITTLAIGLAPALGASRVHLAEALKSGTQRTGTGPAHARLRDMLVVAQIGLALVLVVAAGLLVQTFYHLLNSDPGFRREHVLTFELSLPETRYQDRQHIAAFYQQVIPRLQALPGVVSAAAAEAVPMGGTPEATGIRIPGRPPVLPSQAPIVDYTVVSPGFFATVGTPLERGRDFTDSDTEANPAVTVINRAMASKLWPHQDAMGKQVVVPAQPRPMTIVGIVDNLRHSSLSETPSPEMFVPYTQNEWPPLSIMQVVMRTQGDPAALTGAARAAIHAIDPEVPLAKITTLEALTSAALSNETFSMVLLGFFAAFSLLLAAVGIYGVISYAVSQQIREIGIRMALGAPRGAIFSATLSRSVRLAGIGIGCGAVAAVCVGRVLSSYLFGVKADDPLTYIVVALVLALAAAAAGVLPARRAASVDPAQALRAE